LQGQAAQLLQAVGVFRLQDGRRSDEPVASTGAESFRPAAPALAGL